MIRTRLKLRQSGFKDTMRATLDQYPVILRLVDEAVGRGLRNVLLLGCGASYFATWPTHYLLERGTAEVTVTRMNSSEFSCAPPARVGDQSLVIACTHSGETPETVTAAQLARQAGATVVGITSDPGSTLAASVHVVLGYPPSRTVVEPKQLIFGQLGHALLERLGVPGEYAALREAFRALPEALGAVTDEIRDTADDLATRFADEPLIYVLGAGPGLGAARALAMCYLQEMQWIHAVALDAGDFFHGPVEVVSRETPILVLAGEDDSRPVAQRALSFAKRFSDKTTKIDTADFTLPGIAPEMRPKVSPIVLSSAARRLLDHFSAVRGHDTSQRRYMGKTELM